MARIWAAGITYTQAEGIMFRIIDRQERELGLGANSGEEVITTVARALRSALIDSYLHLYQIQAPG